MKKIIREEKGHFIYLHGKESHFNTDTTIDWLITQLDSFLRGENFQIVIHAKKSMIDVYVFSDKEEKSRADSFKTLIKLFDLGDKECEGGLFKVRINPDYDSLFSFTKNHTRVNFKQLPFIKI